MSNIRKTHEKFVQEVEEKYPNIFKFYSKYETRETPIIIGYTQCEHTRPVIPYRIGKSVNCKECVDIARINKFYSDFNVLYKDDGYTVVSKYVNQQTDVTIRHVCGYEFDRQPNALLTKKKCICPKCFPSQGTTDTIPYVNDIYTTNPTLYELLVNKEDGYKYKENSGEKAWFQCKFCEAVHFKVISNVNLFGLKCTNCNSGISYPEKFMINILNQLQIPYKYQFIPSWGNGCRYDFMFEHNKKLYIVEMDGGLGHGKENGLSGISGEESKLKDEIKDALARDNNYHMIRIDCDYYTMEERYNYIKENIKNSLLSTLFDLEKIDFDECNRKSLLSVLNVVVADWNQGIRGYQNLQKNSPLHRGTIRRYLKCASELGLIPETYEEVLKINRLYSNEQLAISKGQKVRCNETNEVFNSYQEARKKYSCDLSTYFCQHRNYSGKLPDGTKLTWTKL